mgnify:CR=1 FL=1
MTIYISVWVMVIVAIPILYVISLALFWVSVRMNEHDKTNR